MACNSTSSGIYTTSSILTPNPSSWVAGPTYQTNQAVCAAWLPEGDFQSVSQGANPSFPIQVAQTYSNLNSNDFYQQLAIAGTGSAPITSLTIQWQGVSGPTNPGTTPGQNAWWGQDPESGQWVVVNLYPYQTAPSMSATVIINGVAAGTVHFTQGWNSAYN